MENNNISRKKYESLIAEIDELKEKNKKLQDELNLKNAKFVNKIIFTPGGDY